MSQVRMGDRAFEWQGGESLLECLERNGVDVASSCRAGACHSCLVKAVAGTPPENAQLGLKETWKEQDLFLACISNGARSLEVALPDTSVTRRALLARKELLGPDVVRLFFRVPEGELHLRAGQFINLVRGDGLTR